MTKDYTNQIHNIVKQTKAEKKPTVTIKEDQALEAIGDLFEMIQACENVIQKQKVVIDKMLVRIDTITETQDNLENDVTELLNAMNDRISQIESKTT